MQDTPQIPPAPNPQDTSQRNPGKRPNRHNSDRSNTQPKTANTEAEHSSSGKPNHPNCMRPCPAALNHPPKTPEDRSKLQFNHRGGPIGRRQPPPEPPKRPDGRLIRQPFDGVAHLYEVIQVRLARTQRLLEVNTNDIRLGPNVPVLVRVHRNILLATTVGYRHRRVAEINSLPFVVRIATDEDRTIDAENAVIEKQAQALATGFAIENNLQMKVLSADLSHDHKNITINFASDVRVDFRTMVAYLAGQLKLRVEMYQLGLRNGTGLICGLGACGQLLCCGRFLGQFDPIAVKQLRAQGLAANPKRISGVCGRLYCCMSYEYVDYMKEQRTLPRKGKRVFTRWGIGRVTDIDMLREDIAVTYENGDTQRITPNDFLPVTDEIIARVESGEIEFPLEPAHFYLNRDPSTACEMETRTQIRNVSHVPHSPQPKRRMEASTTPKHTPLMPVRHEKKETTAEQPKQLRRRRTTQSAAPLRRSTAHPTSPAPQTAPFSAHTPSAPAPLVQPNPQENPKRQIHHNIRHTRTVEPHQPLQPAPSAAPNPATTRNSVEKAIGHSQISRVPRKVKARQANLEETATHENRRDPSRSSRRRYAPLNQNNPPDPEK